jgi:predicted nucleotidyltransferase component of viral defense system
LVFKGGTAIHHLYLDQLRFSEDLDFSATEAVTIDDIEETFQPYDFLQVLKFYDSGFSLKIERLKFTGPLGQPNSIKIDIDLTQKLVLPAERHAYQNVFGVPVTVAAMALPEVCAEKVRAMNERARYRDFYDLAMVIQKHAVEPERIGEILAKKELRKPLSGESILANLKIADEARRSGAENLYYQEEIGGDEMMTLLKPVISELA